MSFVMNWKPDLLDHSVQINDGFTQTSADGAALAFDAKYGIMFCAYMPGFRGHYGESRGKIALSCFPASQPTNIRFVTVAEGNDVYCNNILGLGDGKVRIFYEKDSRADTDHTWCYKDFDFLANTLSEEKAVMVQKEDGTVAPICLSLQFAYLESQGYYDHKYVKTEQTGHCGYFRGDDGYTYGAAVSYYAEPILFRSADDGATVEFFAVCPEPAQYEFEYKHLNGKIHAIFRTDRDIDAISYTTSDDNGKTWSKPVHLKDSIQCRPRIIIHNGHVLLAYNYFNGDCGNRPLVQQGRTSVRMLFGENADPNTNTVVADLYSKCGIVNICLADILGDLYFAYSTSMLALEYHNGNPRVRGKDALRYVRLGDLTPEQYRIPNVVTDHAMGKNAQ